MMERALLLFEDKFPCWNAETFVLVDEDPSYLGKLEKIGLLAAAGGGYVLTPEGEAQRLKTAEKHYLPAIPNMFSLPITDAAAEAALWNNKLYLLMERAFLGQFGIKEYSVDEKLPSVPRLPREELWHTGEGGRVEYLWPKHPLLNSFMERFPLWGVAARKKTAPGYAAVRKWADDCGAKFDIQRFNLILRSRYDFELYRKMPHLPEDIFYMKDADRLFFLRTSDKTPAEIYDAIGRLHLFMLGQRRVYIPGYADIDSQEQENWTMLVLVADTEDELAAVYERYSFDGKNLIEPANPIFIVGTSIDRLRGQRRTEYTVYDWFCDRTVHIVRPDA